MRIIKPSTEILGNIDGYEILRKIERIGRVCYKSEDKISNSSTLNFVGSIIKSGHLSVFEHVSISVRIICDRGVSHELVRHRLCSFSQESTRYCNYSDTGVTFVVPPWVSIPIGDYRDLLSPKIDWTVSDYLWFYHMWACESKYKRLIKAGWRSEQARTVLPNSLKTELIMTCNLREWRHIFKLRCSKKAHPQMFEIMDPLESEMQERIPIVFNT